MVQLVNNNIIPGTVPAQYPIYPVYPGPGPVYPGPGPVVSPGPAPEPRIIVIRNPSGRRYSGSKEYKKKNHSKKNHSKKNHSRGRWNTS